MVPSLREWLPEEDLSWFIVDAVGQMELREFYAAYRETAGERRPTTLR